MVKRCTVVRKKWEKFFHHMPFGSSSDGYEVKVHSLHCKKSLWFCPARVTDSKQLIGSFQVQI